VWELVRAHMYAEILAYIHMILHTYTYIHAYIHIRTCVRVSAPAAQMRMHI
jgi:hypothetical protein